jgi:hypothetical protein
MRRTWPVIFLCVLAACTCREPTSYGRVIIDTYPPTSASGTVDTKLSLYEADGDLVATASDGNPEAGYARIDYSGGLEPGDWYIRAEGEDGSQSGHYAIRVLLAPDENYAPWQFAGDNDPDSYEPDNASSYNVPTSPIAISVNGNINRSLTPDDDASSGNVPANPVSIPMNGRVNRYLTAGDIDWLVLSLPTSYELVIIDTYYPTAGPGSVNTKLSLYDAGGNLVAAASDGNPSMLGFARIDCTDGLESGVWYIRCEGEVFSQNGPYAIRVLDVTPPEGENYTPWWFSAYNFPDSYDRDVDWFILSLP